MFEFHEHNILIMHFQDFSAFAVQFTAKMGFTAFEMISFSVSGTHIYVDMSLICICTWSVAF